MSHKGSKIPLTLESFREKVNEGLWEHDNKRPFHVMTGSRGYQMFQVQFRRSALLAILEDMTEHFTPQEMTRLKEMINSEDVENMEVANSIIDFKLKLSNQIPNQDVSNIQIRESQLSQLGSR